MHINISELGIALFIGGNIVIIISKGGKVIIYR